MGSVQGLHAQDQVQTDWLFSENLQFKTLK